FAVLLGLAWAAVVFHAFWLSRPRRIQSPRRGVATGIALAVCVLLLVPFGIVARYAGVQRDLVSSMFPSGGSGPKGRMNVLLIGGDSGGDRTGTRTDSMIVASTDLATGRTTLISLPRNMEHVPMPDGPARQRFPNGFDDLLNAVYAYGEQHPAVVPGSKRPGPDLLKETVSGILGIPVHYYLLVNLKGFQKMVDALGGVTIRVNERLPIGGDGGVPITGYVPKGLHRLNGYQALWYARSRLLSSDYDRMTRQRCLIGAIEKQADPATVFTRYQQLAAASKQLFQTDIPQNVMSKLVTVAQKAKKQKMKSLALVPPLVNTSEPDWQRIKDKTRQAIDASMRAPAGKHTSSPHRTPSASRPTKTPTGAVSVDSVCRYN
ncbi:MAG: LCP family protein, partial [Streptosporangiales bacterium]|nr:LCP family protein [Streptosporangiales bacterium]